MIPKCGGSFGGQQWGRIALIGPKPATVSHRSVLMGAVRSAAIEGSLFDTFFPCRSKFERHPPFPSFPPGREPEGSFMPFTS